MKVKSNVLVKLAVPLTILAAALIGVKACSNRHEQTVIFDKTGGVLAELTPEDLKAMGIEGDTPQDTLRTLVGSLRAVTGRQNQLDAANNALADENKNLKQLTQNVDERINRAIADSQANTHKAQVQEITSQISVLMQTLKDKGNHSDIPVGRGLSGGGFENAPLTLNHDGLQWIEPNDGVVDVTGKSIDESNNNTARGFTFATSFLDNNVITRQKAELVNKTDYRQNLEGNNVAEGPVEPVFTLPENSTLIGSRAMTALLGRVPINGKVTDPYPFKVLIGKDNLTANGIDLPDVQGAIVSGTATGDWTLSCVRGVVTSITFVFTDGTVRTLPHPTDKTEKNNNKNNSIGWLSDENGIPCLSGERKSNASTYLPTLFALSASSAAGDALAQNQNIAQTNANGVASRLTGDAGKVLMGKAISGGMQETAEWVKARYGQTFDAVYVPPGSKVAVHITRQLTIDYEEKGRKVKYDFSLSQPEIGMD